MHINKMSFFVFLVIPMIINSCVDKKAVKAGAEKKSEALQMITPQFLRKACLDGKLEQVEKAVTQGIDIGAQDQTGKTPLMLASYNGHTGIIRYLLDQGAKINREDNQGRKALMFASSGPYPDAVKLLLDAGAKVNVTDSKEGWSSLMFAAAEGNKDVVKVLIDAGADPSLTDVDGDEAIDFARNNGHAKVVTLLE